MPKNRELSQAAQRRLEKDEQTVMAMARIYCRGHHHTQGQNGLCNECLEIVQYSFMRTRACPHEHKGTCDTCTIHCFKPEMRSGIRAIMAYSGPRMMLHHPLLAIQHLIRKRRSQEIRS